MGSAETRDRVSVTIGVVDRVGWGNLELQPTNNNKIPKKCSLAATTGVPFAKDWQFFFEALPGLRKSLSHTATGCSKIIELTVLERRDVEEILELIAQRRT